MKQESKDVALGGSLVLLLTFFALFAAAANGMLQRDGQVSTFQKEAVEKGYAEWTYKGEDVKPTWQWKAAGKEKEDVGERKQASQGNIYVQGGDFPSRIELFLVGGEQEPQRSASASISGDRQPPQNDQRASGASQGGIGPEKRGEPEKPEVGIQPSGSNSSAGEGERKPTNTEPRIEEEDVRDLYDPAFGSLIPAPKEY